LFRVREYGNQVLDKKIEMNTAWRVYYAANALFFWHNPSYSAVLRGDNYHGSQSREAKY
jgi:hypothetical protein